MHELSIAQALVEQVRRYTPAGSRATIVRVEAGPFQTVDPEALSMAWQVLAQDTELAGARLEATLLPYQLNCPACRRQWTSTDPFALCTCGAEAQPSGTSDLRLLSLEVETIEPAADPGPCRGTCRSRAPCRCGDGCHDQ